MAKKRTGGHTRNGRDSQPKYLGVKAFGGQIVQPGSIIVRQRGSHFHAGHNTDMGRDYTIFALSAGRVLFKHKSGPRSKHIIDVVS